jgi:hypothetical protein
MKTPVSDSELAWDLVESNRHNLDDGERSMAYVHLGAGDYLVSLLYILEVLVHKQIGVSADFGVRLAAWADTYDIGPAARNLLEKAVVSDGDASLDAASLSEQ